MIDKSIRHNRKLTTINRIRKQKKMFLYTLCIYLPNVVSNIFLSFLYLGVDIAALSDVSALTSLREIAWIARFRSFLLTHVVTCAFDTLRFRVANFCKCYILCARCMKLFWVFMCVLVAHQYVSCDFSRNKILRIFMK
jgi:hypothetical protein